jgi:cysteine desulfurase/selenocysteine lyase
MRFASDALARARAADSLREFDVRKIREEFPILKTKAHGKPLVYLDNAATTQKPRAVIEAVTAYYAEANANVHRGIHYLSERATALHEESREKVRRFLNARELCEIIFVRGTTEAINLVASSYGRPQLRAGDEILITGMEHHSNIVPWQLVCEQTGARLRVIPISDEGELELDEYERLLGPRTRLVSIVHVSNALGTINPVKQMIEKAHRRKIPVLVDGAQAAPHLRIDVQDLKCDFYALSGHKMYAPTGIGVLYGKMEHLEEMPPYQGGGEMIATVSFEKTIYNELPHKFEAGTPNVGGVVGLGAAIDYIDQFGIEAVGAHEHDVLAHATEKISSVPGVTLVGTAREKASVLSFVMENAHPHDVGTVLDRDGIAIRAGHHCAQPLMHRFGLDATVRASFGLYNTKEEADALAAALHKVNEIFG